MFSRFGIIRYRRVTDGRTERHATTTYSELA